MGRFTTYLGGATWKRTMQALESPHLPPDLLVTMLVPTLWSEAMAGRQANVCVDACRILQHAYGQFGMRAELHAVALDVVNPHGQVIHHAPEPSWKGTVLDGHCILHLPDDHRFVDATVEQYRHVAHLHLGVLVGRVDVSGDAAKRRALRDGAGLPAGTVLSIERKRLTLEYSVGDGAATQVIVAHPVVADNVGAHRRAGVNLASHTLQCLRIAGLSDRARAAPYPRLHALLDALGESPAEPDEAHDWHFELAGDDGTVRRLRLDEVPLPPTTPPAVGEEGPVNASSIAVSSRTGGIARWQRRSKAHAPGKATPGSGRLRDARPGECDEVNRFLGLAGVELNIYLLEAVEDGTISSALIRAVESAESEVLRELVTASERGDPNLALPGLSTVVVAEGVDGALVGAALALPPFAVFARAANAGLPAPLALAGLSAVVKIKGLGVAEHARGAGIGSALVSYCTKRYLSLGYHLVYGQIRVSSGLETYYPRLGFEVLAAGEAVSLSALSLPFAINPEPGERLIILWG